MPELSEKDEKWLKLQLKVQEKLIVDAVRYFEKFNIETVLIKGRAIAEFYPAKYLRTSADIDLCVEPEKYLKAQELLDTFSSSANIDLHEGLRYLDTVKWAALYGNCKTIILEGGEVKVLSPEDSLRVISVHWLRDGGEFKERLWDIYWLVENRPPDFDWARCLEIVAPHRRRWVICAIGAAHKYLNLKIDDLPFAEEAKNLPEWFFKTLEREWESDLRLIPLLATSNDSKAFFRQIRKRFPPNSITATIMSEGRLDAQTRAFYQIENIFHRLKRSIHNFYKLRFAGKS